MAIGAAPVRDAIRPDVESAAFDEEDAAAGTRGVLEIPDLPGPVPAYT